MGGGLLTPFLVHDSRCHTRGRVPGPALLTTNGARWGWEERPASLSPWSYGSESPMCEGWEPFPPEEEHWGTLPVPFTSPAGRTEGS